MTTNGNSFFVFRSLHLGIKEVTYSFDFDGKAWG